MKSDLSRPTFNPLRHYTRLHFQQGRPPLDADLNEQTEILQHSLRSYAKDIIGEHGGTAGAFAISLPTSGTVNLHAPDFTVGNGHYYVDGLQCENVAGLTYDKLPFPRPAEDEPPKDPLPVPALVYIDVWEHHRTWIDDGVIVDPALGGIDTAARSRVVWQVRLLGNADLDGLRLLKDEELKALGVPDRKVIDLDELAKHTAMNPRDGDAKKILELRHAERGQLRVRIKPGAHDHDCCKAHAETRYRGIENQLYRVEIHRQGVALPADLKPNDKNDPDGSNYAKHLGAAATFKWSRENGSVAAKWLQGGDCNTPGSLTLRVLGPRDQAHGFAQGQWIEVTDETRELRGEAGILAHIARAEGDTLTLDSPADPLPVWKNLTNPKVRRWDQKDISDHYFDKGAVAISENAVEQDKGRWIDLENGLQIQFVGDGKTAQKYKTGDYWLIPVRVATGAILWPWNDSSQDGGAPPIDALPPHGINHHYAPLAIITAPGNVTDLRRELMAIAKPI